MWTVTLDSNVPIVTNNDQHSIHGSGRASVDALTAKERDEEVEELLSPSMPSSPIRSRSSSLSRRPPKTRPTKASSYRSRSETVSRPKSPSPSEFFSQKHRWQEERDDGAFEAALENSVPFVPDSDVKYGLNSSFDSAMLHSGHHESLSGRGNFRDYMKTFHNDRTKLICPDSDSGFDSMKPHNGIITSDDIHSTLCTRMSRSRSMSRLNGSFNGDSPSVSSSQRLSSVVDFKDKSIRELNSSLEESEARRNVLVHKLKEAQKTLELQSDRLNKIDVSAKENNMLVEDLKLKEREYRKKISQLESAEEEKHRVQMENLRLREEMQDRISTLDYQLNSLKNQHKSTESENNIRLNQLDNTTAALSLLEEENSRLQQEKDKFHSEAILLKEAFALTQTRFGALDTENRNLKNVCLQYKEDNNALTRKVQEMAGQMIELRSLLQAVKDENERLSSTHKTSTEDKSRAAKQVEGYQDTITDLKARLSATSADRDRLFQEKLEMSGKIQQMVLDKEQMMKTKLNLEDQLNEKLSKRYSARSIESQYDTDVKEQLKELASVKKVSEGLSAELSSVKTFYERAIEQVAALERNKSMMQSQQELGEQERRRLQSEIDRMNMMFTNQTQDGKKEQDYQEEMIHKLRHELKQVRAENNSLENRNQELEIKLGKANEGIREGTALQQSELDTWKQTCDRLTTSVSWKESELQNFTDRNHELEDTNSGLRMEMRALKDKCDMLSDKEEEQKRLQEENRRLVQEKAENEQMIKLLETQKEVLSKNSEDSVTKINKIESLSIQMDQLRNDNQSMRKKISQLEEEQEELIHQKEMALATSEEYMYKAPSLTDLETKMEELRTANKQLRDINESMSTKLETITQENVKLKLSQENSLTKKESDQLQEENVKLKADVNNLKHEYGALDAKHQRFVINYGQDGDLAAREKQDMVQLRKEKDAIQKQVTLLQGQISLMEGSKKRADDQISKLTSELAEMRAHSKEKESQESFKRELSSEEEALRKEIEVLKKQLDTANENTKIQNKIMENLREESLEDVGAELHQMQGELQQLMKEIQSKEQTIENLELELRENRKGYELNKQEVEEYRKAMDTLQSENEELRQNVRDIRDLLASDLEQEKEEQSLKRSKSAKSLQEELAEAVKAKREGSYGKTRTPNAFLSKSLNELTLRPASAPPTASDSDTPKAATEGTERLQSLISKYRSHGDKDSQIKPLPGFVSSKIVSKPKLGSGKAPMRRSLGESQLPTPVSPLAKQEKDGVVPSIVVKPPKKLPPPPPPKPSHAKSFFMRSVSENFNKDGQSPPLSSSSPLLSSQFTSTTPTAASSVRTPKTLPQSMVTSASGSAASLNSSGLGSSSSAEALGDSQEQKDINALIQKYLKVLETS